MFSPDDDWDADIDDGNDFIPSDWTPETGYNIAEETNNIFPRPGPGRRIFYWKRKFLNVMLRHRLWKSYGINRCFEC